MTAIFDPKGIFRVFFFAVLSLPNVSRAKHLGAALPLLCGLAIRPERGEFHLRRVWWRSQSAPSRGAENVSRAKHLSVRDVGVIRLGFRLRAGILGCALDLPRFFGQNG
jgi:hypothetical protein